MEKVYRSSKIAETLGVGQSTIQKWVTSGKLKGYYESGTRKGLLITESELIKFFSKKPKYKVIWDNPQMKEAPYDIKTYIREKLKVLRELQIDLTANQTLYLWSLRTEFAIDGFIHDVIMEKTRIK